MRDSAAAERDAGEIKDHWTTDEVAGRTSDPLIKLCEPVGDRQFGRQHERHVRTTAETHRTLGTGNVGHNGPHKLPFPRAFLRVLWLTMR